MESRWGLRDALLLRDNAARFELQAIQKRYTKAFGCDANSLGFSKLKLGIGSTHPTVPNKSSV
jgi:hypothetical protein